MNSELDRHFPSLSGLRNAVDAPRPERKNYVGGFFELTDEPLFVELEQQGLVVRFGDNDTNQPEGYPTRGYDRFGPRESVVNFDGLIVGAGGTAGLSAKSRLTGGFGRDAVATVIGDQHFHCRDGYVDRGLVTAGGIFVKESIGNAAQRLASCPQVSLMVLPLRRDALTVLGREDATWEDLVSTDLVEHVETVARDHGVEDRMGALTESASRLRISRHLAEHLA